MLEAEQARFEDVRVLSDQRFDIRFRLSSNVGGQSAGQDTCPVSFANSANFCQP
jgi:hypothetical protein